MIELGHSRSTIFMSSERVYAAYSIDVKNINLQIKNIKKMFFHFYKKHVKTYIKNIEPHFAQ